MHCTWLWIITSDHLQHTMGMIPFCLPPLGSCLCTRYIPAYNGADPWLIWRCDWHCWWCYHTWKGPWRTNDSTNWWKLPKNMDSSSVERSVQSNVTQWSSLDVSMTRTLSTLILQSLCYEGDACSTITHRTPKLPKNGNLSGILHTLTVHTHSTTMGTTRRRWQIHLECYLLRSIWQTQVLGIHWHHTLILRCEETSDHTSWCLQKGMWNCPSTGWWASCLCLPSAYPNGTSLC